MLIVPESLSWMCLNIPQQFLCNHHRVLFWARYSRFNISFPKKEFSPQIINSGRPCFWHITRVSRDLWFFNLSHPPATLWRKRVNTDRGKCQRAFQSFSPSHLLLLLLLASSLHIFHILGDAPLKLQINWVSFSASPSSLGHWPTKRKGVFADKAFYP